MSRSSGPGISHDLRTTSLPFSVQRRYYDYYSNNKTKTKNIFNITFNQIFFYQRIFNYLKSKMKHISGCG